MKNNIITTIPEIRAWSSYLMDQDAFAFDVETWGPHRNIPAVNEVLWLSMASHGRTAVIPLGHPNGTELISKARRKKNKETGEWDQFPAVFSAPPEQLNANLVFEELHDVFFSSSITSVAHNSTFDILSVAKYFYGEYPPPPYGDTIVAGWLLDENRQKGLKSLTKEIYGLTYDKENVGKCVENFDFGKVARYSWLDAKMTWLLWERFMPLLLDADLANVWELEMEVLGCLLHMGSNGTYVDVEAMEKLREELREELIGVEADVYKAAGVVFNLGSVPQKQEVLYGDEGQQLEPNRLTPGGVKKKRAGTPLTIADYSTDDEALKGFQGNPVVDRILKYQEISKIKGTYLDGYLGTDEKPSIIFNNRVYPKFAQYGCVTGRFSCRAPNLQNIPVRGETGKKIRDFYIPFPGEVLIIADYAQIELRILAHYCRDGKLYEGFMNGLDAHTATAAVLFGVDPSQVTKSMRQVAKALAFANIYEAGDEKLASMANVSLKEVAKFKRQHQVEFPEIYEFKAKLLKVASSRQPPHIRTLAGRYRRLPDLRSSVKWKREAAIRQLTNSVCQGGNADIIKTAMGRLNRLRPPGMKLLITVHDELIASAPKGMALEAAAAMKEAMVGDAMQKIIRVPIITDVKICERWSEGKD